MKTIIQCLSKLHSFNEDTLLKYVTVYSDMLSDLNILYQKKVVDDEEYNYYRDYLVSTITLYSYYYVHYHSLHSQSK